MTPRTCAALSPPRQTEPRFATHPGGYLAVFRSEISGEASILAQRLTANGEVLDPEPIVVTRGSSYLWNPAIAWNGSVFLVVWEVWENSAESQVYMRRIGADGVPIDPLPLLVMPGNDPDVAAIGDVFLVVDTHAANPHFRYPKAVRVRGTDGAVLGSPAMIGGYFALSTSVAALGDRWLVTWQRNPTHDDTRGDIYACFVDADGSIEPDFTLTQTMIASEEAPWVASKEDLAFIVWHDNRAGGTTNDNLFARRVLADGTLLDPSGIQLTTAPNNQILPVAAWNGVELIVSATDYRNEDPLFQPIGDVYATRMDSNGILLDPDGFPVMNDPVIAEIDAAVASAANEQALCGAAVFRAGTGAYRIGIRLMNARVTAIEPTPAPPGLVGLLTVSPNPSHGDVYINLGLLGAGPIRAAVYSATGREVRLLHAGAVAAGVTTLRWDGRDRSGKAVPRGPYFVRIMGGENVLAAKLVRH
jgi:hypothetical protein